MTKNKKRKIMTTTNTVKNVTVIGINPTKVTFKYQINHTGVTE